MKRTLEKIRALLRPTLNADLFENDTWIHIHQCQRVRTGQRAFIRTTAAEEKRLLVHAQALLAPIGGCPQVRPRWKNARCCLDSPYGCYWWMVHCEMVQEILWMYPEFVKGYKFGRKAKGSCRDQNPYAESSRNKSWDLGYILGLADPKKIVEFLRLDRT